MTHRIITLAALTLALSSGSLFAKSSEEPSAMFYETAKVKLNHYPAIEEGVAKSALRMTITSPDVMLTPNIWLYHTGFAPNSDRARSDRCDKLLIVFSDDRVSKIYFINENARKVVQARVNTNPMNPDAILATVLQTPDGQLASK